MTILYLEYKFRAITMSACNDRTPSCRLKSTTTSGLRGTHNTDSQPEFMNHDHKDLLS